MPLPFLLLVENPRSRPRYLSHYTQLGFAGRNRLVFAISCPVVDKKTKRRSQSSVKRNVLSNIFSPYLISFVATPRCPPVIAFNRSKSSAMIQPLPFCRFWVAFGSLLIV